MSLVNAFVYPDHAFVCVDTEAVLPDGTSAEVSKLFALPHVNAVVACRGTVLLNSILMAFVVAADGDFDGISKRLPNLLSEAFERAIALAPALSVAEELVGCAEVIIVGFSPAMDRIVLHSFKRETLAGDFVTTNNVGSYSIGPYWADIGLNIDALRLKPNGEGLETLALAQVQLMRVREPAAAAGGRLILAEIRRGSMTIRTVCDLPWLSRLA